MTAKEELRAAVEDLSEAEAADALAMVARVRRERLENARADEAPTNSEDDDADQPGRDQASRGDTVSVEQVRAEFSRHRS
jgi:hypothetical protein